MKKHILLPITLLAFMLSFFSCQKEEDMIKEPSITESSIEVHGSQVTFNWTVDYPGKVASVVEISLNADMTNSHRYGSESYTDNKTFTATATGLDQKTTYYYRYLVWNPNSSFECDTKSFSILNGYIDALFSVSPSAKVYFSQGNLQYIGSNNTWKFADHQWEVIGTDQSNYYQNTVRDLFGWGTSGWDCGNTYYLPYATNNSGGYNYGPPGNNNLTGSYANSDWGVYNAISNGGNQAGLWRTLTGEEWVYVLNTREGSWLNGVANARYVKAKVNDMAGVILFPDNYTHPSGVPELNNINDPDVSFASNSYSGNDWNQMEQSGCVFLPAAGYRNGTSVTSVGSYGHYWSASFCYNTHAYTVSFRDLFLQPWVEQLRYDGRSVRLVCNAQ